MIVRESLLKFENFTVLDSSCNYIYGEGVSRELMRSYPLDIDFEILEHNEERKFKIMISVKLNEDGKPGYSIKVNSITSFSIKDSATEEDMNALIQHSGIQMAIANMRAYIEVITSYCPLGRYTIPTIDLHDLLNQKISASSENGL